jgi:hypothetical protein
MNGNVSAGESLHQGKLFKRALTLMKDRLRRTRSQPARARGRTQHLETVRPQDLCGSQHHVRRGTVALRLNHAKDILQDARFAAYRNFRYCLCLWFYRPEPLRPQVPRTVRPRTMALRNHA